jgi:ABC-type lipoprotein release transport system permease subunit
MTSWRSIGITKRTPEIGLSMAVGGVALGIGVFIGFDPARKAARLNPVEALRFE